MATPSEQGRASDTNNGSADGRGGEGRVVGALKRGQREYHKHDCCSGVSCFNSVHEGCSLLLKARFVREMEEVEVKTSKRF